jgi:hypothetical protein
MQDCIFWILVENLNNRDLRQPYTSGVMRTQLTLRFVAAEEIILAFILWELILGQNLYAAQRDADEKKKDKS